MAKSHTNINVFDEQNDVRLRESVVRDIVRNVLALENVLCDEVSVFFVTESEISQLHEEFFDDPSTTDTISFPIDTAESDLQDDYKILGDVFVCPKAAIEYAKTHDDDPYTETVLYLVHGLLHLIGYDDIGDAERENMRSAEQKHMSNLKKLGLLDG